MTLISPFTVLLSLLCAGLGLSPAAVHAQSVQTGLDALIAEDFATLRERRVGLITNHTGRAADGRLTVDVFARQDRFELAALFSPEHGFEGVLDQANIANATHGNTGLEIHSLYGKTRKPTKAMLHGVDTIVFDIQDIGCRFYTYVTTMRLAMEAAAEHDIAMIVLDRPNPIGGTQVLGPVLDEGMEFFAGFHEVAVQHGMTAGELARMMNVERKIGCDLQVVTCKGWRRSMLWDETGLRWTDPSPNMRTLNQALLYPGVGLVEFTNVSVGRGTDTPFEILGAPWLEELAFAAALRAADTPGVTFVPVKFTPDSTTNRFPEQLCRGVQILITDRAKLDALKCGLAIACTLRELHEDQWQVERFARLLCDRRVHTAVAAGQPAKRIVQMWQKELASFQRRRQRYLLYGE